MTIYFFCIREMLNLLVEMIGDPWRDATVSADNLNVPSTAQQPIGLGDGFHCSDLGTSAGVADATILAVQKQALASIKGWLAVWKPSSNGKPTTRPKSVSAPAQKQPAPVNEKPLNAWFRNFGKL